MTQAKPRKFEMSDAVSVVIPTVNSSQYIDIILSYYQDHGIPVTVFVDDRSEDDTLAIARRYASEATSLPNPGGFVAEGLVEHMSRACRTPWVLRVDDDELPSEAMLEWVQQAIRSYDVDVWGFPRHQCAVSGKGKLLGAGTISPLDHRQWRLYQPARVTYSHGLHLPGFDWKGEARSAPVDACLAHLDWALHSYGERRRKVERYDAHSPGEGTRWRSYYLYEEQEAAQAFCDLPLPEFEKVSLQLAERFPHLCVDV